MDHYYSFDRALVALVWHKKVSKKLHLAIKLMISAFSPESAIEKLTTKKVRLTLADPSNKLYSKEALAKNAQLDAKSFRVAKSNLGPFAE